jgi:hypothetical protein
MLVNQILGAAIAAALSVPAAHPIAAFAGCRYATTPPCLPTTPSRRFCWTRSASGCGVALLWPRLGSASPHGSSAASPRWPLPGLSLWRWGGCGWCCLSLRHWLQQMQRHCSRLPQLAETPGGGAAAALPSPPAPLRQLAFREGKMLRRPSAWCSALRC